MKTTVYRGYDQRSLDREYSPSSRVPDITIFLDRYALESEKARETLPAGTGLRYGPAPCETFDYFPADRPDAPLLVFVHGGYWQELSKNESSFPASGLVPAGVAFAAIDYGLAPEYDLDEIVTQVRRAVRTLVANAPRLGVDPGRIHLAGSSAGAHLALMALFGERLRGGVHPSEAIAGAVLLSGVYDLEPLRHTYVNEALGLDATAVQRLSPIRHLPKRLPPLIVARGGAETDEFVRQHDDLVTALTSRAASTRDLVIEHRNHFDITFDLADPATALGAAVFRQLGVRR